MMMSEWQPIETVPSGGGAVLVGGRDQGALGDFQWAAIWRPGQNKLIDISGSGIMMMPTHWMIVPELPLLPPKESKRNISGIIGGRFNADA